MKFELKPEPEKKKGIKGHIEYGIERIGREALAVVGVTMIDVDLGRIAAASLGPVITAKVYLTGMRIMETNLDFAMQYNRLARQANEEFARMYESRPKISED